MLSVHGNKFHKPAIYGKTFRKLNFQGARQIGEKREFWRHTVYVKHVASDNHWRRDFNRWRITSDSTSHSNLHTHLGLLREHPELVVTEVQHQEAADIIPSLLALSQHHPHHPVLSIQHWHCCRGGEHKYGHVCRRVSVNWEVCVHLIHKVNYTKTHYRSTLPNPSS